LDVKEAIEKAWNMVIEKFKRDTDDRLSLHWNEEALMLYFFNSLNNLDIKIRQIASKSKFLLLDKEYQPDLVFSAETDGRIERAVIELKFFAGLSKLEEDWEKLEKYKELYFDRGYINYGYLLAFTTDEYGKDVLTSDDYEIKSLVHKSESRWFFGSPMDVAERIIRKVFLGKGIEYAVDDYGNPFAFFEDYAVFFILVKDVGHMSLNVIFDEKIRKSDQYQNILSEIVKKGYELLNEESIFLTGDTIPITDTPTRIRGIRKMHEKFEKDYSEIRERLLQRDVL